MDTVTINDQVFNERIAQLVDVLQSRGIQSDPAVIIGDEMRLFLKQAIAISPPKNKEAGEKAIEKDARSVFKPLNEDFLMRETGGFGTNADFWFTAKSGAKIHAQFDQYDVHGRGMKKWYKSLRGANGRPTRYRAAGPGKARGGAKIWGIQYAVGYSAFTEFVQAQILKVGMRKSGWIRGYYDVGGKLPKWIERHASRGLGRVQNNLSTPGKPSIIVASHSPGVKDDERVLRAALRARSAAIASRIKLILSSYAADVKAGMKIRPHAKRTVD